MKDCVHIFILLIVTFRAELELSLQEVKSCYFSRQVNPHLKKLYPNVKRILWTTNVVRGGNKIMDQPTAPAPHLDYYQNDEARVQFHKDHPILDSYWMTMDSNMSH